MVRPTHFLCLLILVVGLAVIIASEAAAAEELEIFAGQNKNGRVNVPIPFNDAMIIAPDPPNPERTYIFSWDFDRSGAMRSKRSSRPVMIGRHRNE